jgi:hypothetical protein
MESRMKGHYVFKVLKLLKAIQRTYKGGKILNGSYQVRDHWSRKRSIFFKIG